MIDLKGIIPPVPTSFDAQGDLAPGKLKDNIRSLLSFDLTGILVLGSNGESVMLSDREKDVVFDVAREAIPGDRLMIAGTGGQSTRETIALTRMAAGHGADAALVLNPYYYKAQMTREALVSHYHAVADSSQIPLIIYNMPANSGLDMDASTILAIAKHPNIIGLKDSGGNMVKMAQVTSQAGEGFRVLAGGAGFLLPALTTGAAGGILALANITPQTCLDLISAFQSGDIGRAQSLQQKIIPLNTAVTRRGGVPALKAAMDLAGRYGGPPRKPLLPADEAEQEELAQLLESL